MPHLCFLDLETTGFDPLKDSIIEIAFLRFDGETLVGEMDQVITPDKSALSPIVSQMTGITQPEIDQKGKRFADLVPEIIEAIGDSIIVGHNIDFDIGFLKANGIDLTPNGRMDTHELARILLFNEESYALEVLSEKYKFSHEDAHRAMSDVWASKDLWHLLEKKTQALPQEYLKAMAPALQKTDWKAQALFKEPGSGEAGKPGSPAETGQAGETGNRGSGGNFLELPSKGACHLFRAHEKRAVVESFQGLIQQHADQSFFVSTDQPAFYPTIDSVYGPDQILDPEKLQGFAEGRETLSDQEIVFYLKLQRRLQEGLQEKAMCDIFFQEKSFWQEVCVEGLEHPVYQSYLAQKADTRVLQGAHKVLLLLRHHDILQDRTMLVDEGESFVSQALFYPTQSVGLWDYIEHPDPKINNQTIFFVRRFCQQVLEKILDHALTPFPTKVALPQTDYETLASELLTLGEGEDLSQMAHILRNPSQYDLRWAYYNPNNGYLGLSTWNKADWQQSLKDLSQHAMVVHYRHQLPEKEASLFKAFFNPRFEMLDSRFSDYPHTITIPDDLMSSHSPDYPEYCARKILGLWEKRENKKGWIAVHVSSITTLRLIHEHLLALLEDPEAVTILAERVNGGEGKVKTLLKRYQDRGGIFFFSQMQDPLFEAIPWEALVLQKFPFDMPHPLLDWMKSSVAKHDISFWDTWVIPHVGATISRKFSGFGRDLPLHVIDPKENAKWAKGVWRAVK